MYQMTVICMCCNKVIGHKEVKTKEKAQDISHGICLECLQKHYPKQYEAMKKRGKV